MADLIHLGRIIQGEFADIAIDVQYIDAKLRVFLVDDSYLDFWWSEVQEGRFARHWNRKSVDGTIYRHDNSPHRKWSYVKTFPQHYHNEHEDKVTDSLLPQEPQEAVRAFLSFCRQIIQASKMPS